MCFFVFLTGCQNDDFTGKPEAEQQETTTVPGSSSVVNHQQMSQNQDLLAILTKISSQAKARGVDIPTAQYSFTVDTSFANYYENDNYHSYSFLITSNPENRTGNMQNFLVSSNPDGSYDTFLMDFGFTEGAYNTMNEREINNTQPVLTPLYISSLNPPVDNDPTNPILAPFICINLVWDEFRHCSDPGDHSAACGGWVITFTDCFVDTASSGTNNNGGNYIGGNYPGGYDNNPPLGGGTSGDGDDDPGNSITILPLDSAQLLLYKLKPSGQAETNHFQDLIDAAEAGLVNELLDLYNSSTEYGNLKQFTLDLLQYNKDNSSNPATAEFIEEAFKIKKVLPDARFDRFEELSNKLDDNSFALLDGCAEENGLDTASYQSLYDHELPQSCKDRLNSLGPDFENQPLDDGNTACANIDYYSVEITSNTDFDGDGQEDSASEILLAFKENFLDLASGEKDDFQFSCITPITPDTGDIHWDFEFYGTNDQLLWSLNNSVNAILKIDAGASNPLVNFTSDIGAIMISEHTNDHFIGSTITTSESGSQPFSGNREWGVLTNQNGNFEIFTRAVDVAKISSIIQFGPGSDECKEDTYYNIAEATWQNLQDKIEDWVEDEGNGQANISITEAIRVDRGKIKELLESSETIDMINCN